MDPVLDVATIEDPWRASNKWLVSKGVLPVLRTQVPDGQEDEDRRKMEVEDECEPVELSTVTWAVGQPTEMTVSGVGMTRSTGGVVENVGATANVSIEDARLEGQRGGNCPESASGANTYYPDPVRRMAKYPTRPNLLV
ncbi:hypothetical protein RhiJN_26520 [Ceratobasidium sp. AG-Ba]|nr:hypothetical protein RhiJN_12467 [Ceratobasidium sp. AG-Ba]QRV98501.1 hypothetical protein RhiJN_26520 [Ceratobasidium sp. AG-Ba]